MLTWWRLARSARGSARRLARHGNHSQHAGARIRLDQSIRALVFASPDRLYAGTTGGGVYRFDRSEIDGHVIASTWLVIRPASTSQYRHRYRRGSLQSDRIYIVRGLWGLSTCGSSTEQWEPRGGPEAESPDSLLNVQANAIVVDPADPAHAFYVGTDIGSGARRMAG